MSFIDFVIARLKIDWWEVCNCGIVAYFRFARDYAGYLLGLNVRPIWFSYSEKDMDLDFDFSNDTEDPRFDVKD